MDIVIEAVKKLHDILTDSGCEDGPVVLRINPDGSQCQYEKGACMEACFGGRTGEYVTFDPIQATTKVEFMFGPPLDTPALRGAACAILNVVTAFLCLSRNIRACPTPCHTVCKQDLKTKLGTKNVYCLGSIPHIREEMDRFVVDNPDQADIILINAKGLIAPGTGDFIENHKEKKTILLLGPSPAGLASLEKIERFCPYGI